MADAAGAIEIDIRIESAAWHGAVPSLEDSVDAAVRAALEFVDLSGPVSYTHLTLPTIYSV